MNTLIIDGDNLFKIGLYGRKEFYHKQQHIGGLFHFLDTIKKHLESYHYDKVVVFWDGDENSSLRIKIYPYYKSNRRGRQLTENEEFSKDFQRHRVKQYLEELFVRQGEYKNVETDDCISFYCNHTLDENKTIFSGDVDLCQLISEKVKVYNPRTSSFITATDKVYIDGIGVPVCNLTLVKILCGDNSDNVSGIKLMGLKTLFNIIPKISESPTTLSEVIEQGEKLLQEDKQSKVLKNLLSGTSKYGVLGEEFFSVNKRIVDLSEPMLTPEATEDIINLIQQPLDPNNRGWKNLIKMMNEDGLFKYLPKREDAWTKFFEPLLKLARKEKNLFNKK